MCVWSWVDVLTFSRLLLVYCSNDISRRSELSCMHTVAQFSCPVCCPRTTKARVSTNMAQTVTSSPGPKHQQRDAAVRRWRQAPYLKRVSFSFWVELQKQNPSRVCPIFLQMLSQCFYFIPSFLPHFYADPSSFNRNRLSCLSVVSPHRPQAWSQAVNGPDSLAASKG